MPQAWRFAQTQYDPATAGMVAAKLAGWAALGGLGPQRGPGLTQNEAVQFALFLAVMRSTIATRGEFYRVAVYNRRGQFEGVEKLVTIPTTSTDRFYTPIVGDEPVPPHGLRYREAWGALNPDPRWGKQLVLAIDRLLTQIAQAERGGEVPAGYEFPPPGETPVWPAAFPIAGIALIVAGSAVAIIGTAAAWRYLDPDVRVRAAEVAAAARSYQVRLENARATGVMQPPSPLELANAAAVKQAASEQEWRYAAYGAGAVVGIGGGAALLGYMRRRAA